ncbi:MAG: HXXEE domain-containing protein [Bacteroidota bacterium]
MKWVIKYWATFGGIIAIAIILCIPLTHQKIADIHTVSWLHVVTLLLHQFEEYVYPGGFKEFFNQNIYNRNPIIRFPLNDKGVLFINVVLGWTAYLISAIYGDQLLWLLFGLLGVTLLNGILHTFLFVYQKKYNPGFFTACFVMIPFSAYMFIQIQSFLSRDVIHTGILVFIVGMALIPTFIFLTNSFRK